MKKDDTDIFPQPIMSVKETRKILGIIVNELNDDEILELIVSTQEAVVVELRKTVLRKSTVVG